MGMRVRVKTKSNDEVYLTKLNAGLKEQGLKFFSFNTEKSNENWLKEINSKNSEQKHLIPGGQLKLRMSQLKKIFPAWTEIGVLDFDVAFGRTSEENIKKVCEFIVEHKNDIAELDYADDLIERGSLTKEVAKAIKELEKPEEEPEKLPKSEQSLHKDI